MFSRDELKGIVKRVGIWYIMSLIFMFIIDFMFGTLEAFSFNMVFIAGLLGGPYGAVAVTLSFVSFLALEGFLNNLTLSSLPSLIFILSSIFIFSYLVYKLWYSIDSSGFAIRLNSAESIVKFLLILFFSSIFAMVLSVCLFYNLNVDYGELFPLFLSCFTFSLILIPILLVANYFKYSFYYPGKGNIDFLNNIYKQYDDFKPINFINKHPEIFDISFVLFLVSMLISLISSITLQLKFIFNISVWLSLIFGIIFIFKPLANLENQDNVNFNFISITEIVTSLIVAIFVFFFIALLIVDFFNFFHLNITLYDYLIYLAIRFDIIVFIISIPSLFLLFYIQDRITNPITKLSSIVNGYFSTNKISSKDEDYFENYFNFVNRETEVSILAKSFYKMDKDLNDYVENIKSLTKDKERFEAELDVAQHIQNSFLPTNFDIHPDIKISGEMIAAELVGGDFYDFFMIDDNHLAFVIGDVTDKGVPAALFMSKSIQLIQSYLNSLNSLLNLNDVIGLINNKLCENNESCMFVTAWIGIIDLNSGKVSYINAGHEQPILKSGNNYSYLKTETNLVLGIVEDEEYTVHKLNLNKGDELILYTDGVSDANNSKNEFLGKDMLLNILKSNSSSDNSVDIIKKGVIDFTKDQKQFDDITLLAIKYVPKEKNSENKVLHEGKELIFSSTKEKALYDILAIINDLINEYTVNPDRNFRIELIIEEIFVNIVKHAYKGEEGIIKIHYSILDNPLRFKIVFIDDGEEFNPLLEKNPNLSEDINDREVGHLGIFMVREYADEITYEYLNNQNVLSVYVKL